MVKYFRKINFERIYKNMKQTSERAESIKRITRTIDIYASDDQTIRELERIILGWIVMKHKLKQKHSV